MITLYGIRNCDTMKKAFAWLEANGVDYRFVDYKGEAAAERIAGWVDALGWEALVNTRGLTWRKLDEPERRELDRDRAIALMRAHPTLIRRPVVEHADGVLVGFDAGQFAATLEPKRGGATR
jgi:arsenate reductase